MNPLAALAVLGALALAGSKKSRSSGAFGEFVEDDDGDDDDDEGPSSGRSQRFEQMPVACDKCGLKAAAGVTYFTLLPYPTRIWFRPPAYWDIGLPLLDVGTPGNEFSGPRLHCPAHVGPFDYYGDDAPPHRAVNGQWVFPTGWYWAFAEPHEWAAVDERHKMGTLNFHIHKTWGGPDAGFVYLFEVLDDSLLWTLPGMPKLAPSKRRTTLAELTGGQPKAEASNVFVNLLESAAGKAWEVLVNEYERIKKPPPRDPFPWPWER